MMNSFIKKSIEKIISIFPLKNIIVFESLPDYSDNTRAVFNEMVKRGLNKEYKLIWTTHKCGDLPDELKKVIENTFGKPYTEINYSGKIILCKREGKNSIIYI